MLELYLEHHKESVREVETSAVEVSWIKYLCLVGDLEFRKGLKE